MAGQGARRRMLSIYEDTAGTPGLVLSIEMAFDLLLPYYPYFWHDFRAYIHGLNAARVESAPGGRIQR